MSQEASAEISNLPDNLTAQRWASLWCATGARGDGTEVFQDLLRAHSEPQRHYHDLRHLSECLAQLDSIKAHAANPVALEMALWFHDAVYHPQRTDNESRSAQWAAEILQKTGAAPHFVPLVSSLILLTKTHLPNDTPDAELICDIDLSILGREQNRFEEYEEDIRKEYAWVAPDLYSVKRAEVLGRFLQRTRIYVTTPFYERYEAKARKNLNWAVTQLRI